MEQFQLEKLNIDLGNEFEEAKKSIASFNVEIEKLRAHTNDPYYVIWEYFTDLRNKVDIDREIKKSKIDEHYLGLIDELNNIEVKCKNNELEDREHYTKIIEKAEKKLTKFQTDLDALKNDIKKWIDIQKESNQQIDIFKTKINDFQCELLMNKRYTYKSEDFEQYQINKSQIISNTDISNNISNSTIHFRIKNFHKFMSTKATAHASTKECRINGINWYSILKNTDGKHAEFEIGCNITSINKVVSTNIKATLFHPKETRKNQIYSHKHKFTKIEDILSCGRPTFKQIINNGFYNKENDTIQLSVYVQILSIDTLESNWKDFSDRLDFSKYL